MNFENLFEDLEAQFANAHMSNASISNFDSTNLVIVKTANSLQRELIAPIIATDFVAGLDLLVPIWHVMPFHAVRNIRFVHELTEDLPKVRQLNKTLVEFLGATPMPNPAKWRVLGAIEHQRAGQIVGLVGNLICLVDPSEGGLVAVPIQSIQELSIESVDKLNGDF
ncbi:hypothetical protein [Rhodoluna sp.]|uniref:hypothetical protein n=1 Tax=Rhodoluna sp. TaxID=1969481 RepID=UPI0025EE2B07|nr:hypothetical protein [Rhodoluna sp.]